MHTYKARDPYKNTRKEGKTYRAFHRNTTTTDVVNSSSMSMLEEFNEVIDNKIKLGEKFKDKLNMSFIKLKECYKAKGIDVILGQPYDNDLKPIKRRKSSPSPDIHKLPIDMLSEISGFIRGKEYVNFILTDKKMYKFLTARDTYIYSVFTVHIAPKRVKSNIKRIIIPREVPYYKVDDFLEKFPNLSFLKIESEPLSKYKVYDKDYLRKKYITTLEHENKLVVDDYKSFFLTDIIFNVESAINKLIMLRHLDLFYHMHYKFKFRGLKYLDTLIVRFTSPVDDYYDFKEFLKHLKKSKVKKLVIVFNENGHLSLDKRNYDDDYNDDDYNDVIVLEFRELEFREGNFNINTGPKRIKIIEIDSIEAIDNLSEFKNLEEVEIIDSKLMFFEYDDDDDRYRNDKNLLISIGNLPFAEKLKVLKIWNVGDYKNRHIDFGEGINIALNKFTNIEEFVYNYVEEKYIPQMKGRRRTERDKDIIPYLLEDISGMKNWKKLKKLVILNQAINDVSDVFKNMKQLSHLDLRNNSLFDTRGFGYLPNLKFLDLSGNYIGKLSDLDGLKNLQILHINKLENRHFTYGNANFEFYNRISRFKSLSGIKALVNLRVLHAKQNMIKDISEIKELKKLEELNLGLNYIGDISPLRDMKNLKRLNLSGQFLNIKNREIMSKDYLMNIPKSVVELSIEQNNLIDDFDFLLMRNLKMIMFSMPEDMKAIRLRYFIKGFLAKDTFVFVDIPSSSDMDPYEGLTKEEEEKFKRGMEYVERSDIMGFGIRLPYIKKQWDDYVITRTMGWGRERLLSKRL